MHNQAHGFILASVPQETACPLSVMQAVTPWLPLSRNIVNTLGLGFTAHADVAAELRSLFIVQVRPPRASLHRMTHVTNQAATHSSYGSGFRVYGASCIKGSDCLDL